MSAVSWHNAGHAHGPTVAAWIIKSGRLPYDSHDGGPEAAANRAVRRWASGESASIDCLDRHLTAMGAHLSELPDDCWRRGPVNAREHSEDEVSAALDALESGRPLKQLARELHVAPSTLRRWRKVGA